jgi:hypothetical protein
MSDIPKRGLTIHFDTCHDATEWDGAPTTLRLTLTRDEMIAMMRTCLDHLAADLDGEEHATIELAGATTLAGRLPTAATYLENGVHVPGVVVIDELHSHDLPDTRHVATVDGETVKIEPVDDDYREQL